MRAFNYSYMDEVLILHIRSLSTHNPRATTTQIENPPNINVKGIAYFCWCNRDADTTQHPNAKIDSNSIPALLSVSLARQIVPSPSFSVSDHRDFSGNIV